MEITEPVAQIVLSGVIIAALVLMAMIFSVLMAQFMAGLFDD